MKNRDKWITIAFLVFILVIPFVSMVRNLMPQQQQEQLTEDEKAILQNNGTMKEDADSEASTEETVPAVPEEKQPLFTRIQNGINNFTNGYF